jgi:hypothetical protein
MQEAVETASLLRREAYITSKTMFFELPENTSLGFCDLQKIVNKL